ncbi:MAG: hypothetical protein WKG07_46570 [Hymenobacter sp.]
MRIDRRRFRGGTNRHRHGRSRTDYLLVAHLDERRALRRGLQLAAGPAQSLRPRPTRSWRTFSKLDATVVQLPPFEVLGGTHAGDLVTPGKRFFQARLPDAADRRGRVRGRRADPAARDFVSHREPRCRAETPRRDAISRTRCRAPRCG